MFPCNMFYMTFVTWLDNELEQRNWNRSELARRAGFHYSALSNIYAGRRNPGIDLCNGIAKALRLPVAEVYQAAGLLPANPKSDKGREELAYIYNLLPDDAKIDLLDIARAKIKRHERTDGNLEQAG